MNNQKRVVAGFISNTVKNQEKNIFSQNSNTYITLGCSEDSELDKMCFLIGQNESVAKLSKSRCLASSIPVNSKTMWITGGLAPQNSDEEPIKTSTELVSIYGGNKIGPELPRPLYGHCLLRLNESTIFSIG